MTGQPIPNASFALVDDLKLDGYLLSLSHPVGRFKAKFFLALGFSADQPSPLRSEFLRIARESSDTEAIRGEHGTKYLARGILVSPTGRAASVVTVWMIRFDQSVPRFVTAYPDP